MIGKLLKMQLLEDDDELAYAPSDEPDVTHREVDGRPSWMRILCTDLQEWSRMLPKVVCCYAELILESDLSSMFFEFIQFSDLNYGVMQSCLNKLGV